MTGRETYFEQGFFFFAWNLRLGSFVSSVPVWRDKFSDDLNAVDKVIRKWIPK